MYTHAMWRVRPGEEDAFIAAWDELSACFSRLAAPPQWGTLLRSTSERRLFYSFGLWARQADIEAMRSDPAAQRMFATLREVCEEMTPGTYELVRHVAVETREPGA